MCTCKHWKLRNIFSSCLLQRKNKSWMKLRESYSYELTLISICIGATCIGLTVGWPEISSMYYVTPESLNGTFKSVEDIKTTTNLVLNLGACLGALLPPCLVDIFGRRHNFAISASIDILFWTALIFSQTIFHLMLSTAIGGMATGSFVVTMIIYISEVPPSQKHGTVGTLVAFFAYLGILLGSSLSLFVHNGITLLMMCLLTCTFFITIYWWIIESPYFLYETGKMLEAKLALKVLRNASHILEIESEYRTIESFYNSQSESSKNNSFKSLCLTFFEVINQSWTSVIILFLFLSQMLGSYALNKYVEDFIEKIIPEFGKILLAFLDILSLALCVYLIDKVGKKPLFALSVSGLSLSCLILAIDTLIHEVIYKNFSYNYEEITTICVVGLYCVAYSLGMIPVLPIFLGELFPNHYKTVMIGLCISLLYFCAMINQLIFEVLNYRSGAYVAITAFTMIGFLGSFFGYYIIKLGTINFHDMKNKIENAVIMMS